MARTLQQPLDPYHNIRVYDNDGAILASMAVRPEVSLYVTHSMLYRYCGIIFIVPNNEECGLYPLLDDGSLGHLLRDGAETPIRPGNYIVLRQPNKRPITIQLNPEIPPRRVITRDLNTQSRSQQESERSPLQRKFRNNLLKRDEKCVISQEDNMTRAGAEHILVQAAHIIPTSQLAMWNRNYKNYITNESSSESGESRIYSPRNGFLLKLEQHMLFDQFMIGVDPMADYKVIVFSNDAKGLGGKRLKASAIHGANGVPGVDPHFLQWHLRMCVLANMKANAEPRVLWVDDFGEDDMGQILEQEDADQRMETELFTRLGEYIA